MLIPFFYGLHVAFPKGSMEVRMDKLLNAGLAKRNTTIEWRGYNGFINNKGVHGGVNRISKLRPQDSPVYVVRGGIDACITGEDCIRERGLEDSLVEVAKIPLTRAGNSSVAISVFASATHTPWMKNINDLQQKITVVTEYPNIAERYFKEKGIDANINVCHGATEAIVAAGLAVLGVDVVDSGNTLEENGMNVIDTVITSSTVLVTSKKEWSYSSSRAVLQDFVGMLLEEVDS